MAAENGKLPKKINLLVSRWEQGKISDLKLETPKPALLFEKIKSTYDQLITAAGGVVVNRKGRVLVIFRRGKWDLPKGKVEKGENVREAAIREVMEETGLRNVKIRKKIIRTYHTYILKRKHVLKETSWFLMVCYDDKTRPLRSEGITAIEWMSRSRLKSIAANTFDNILLVLKAYIGSIK